jgi:cytochrome c oxidase subunit II
MKAIHNRAIVGTLFVGTVAIVSALTGCGDSGASENTGPGSGGNALLGRQIALKPAINCIFCHSEDGKPGTGPTFKGFFGSTITYEDGSTAIVDEALILEAFKDPIGKIVQGYEPRMPVLDTLMTENEKRHVIAYVKSLK